MAILNSFITDQFEKIASQAAQLARVNKKPTLTSREIQTAVRPSTGFWVHGRHRAGGRQGFVWVREAAKQRQGFVRAAHAAQRAWYGLVHSLWQ